MTRSFNPVRYSVSVLLAAAILLTSDPAFGQIPQGPRPVTPPAPVQMPPLFQDNPGVHETRMELHRLLRQYPPTLGEILMRDPSLLSDEGYLKSYPALVAYLGQHPEIARNPGFFFGTFQFRERDPKERAYEVLGVMLGGLAGMAAFAAFISLLVWLIRAVIDHRRWLRLSRVQTEVHTKLMDRLTSNDDLLAYIQSPAGRRFLESTPIALDGESRPASAPVSRILWSLQAGIVLVSLGTGFWLAKGNVMPEVSEGFYVLAIVGISLGAGFAISGVAAYFISNRLGLVSGSKS
jgi:hypothetical protein